MLSRPNKAARTVSLTYGGMGDVATRVEANGDLGDLVVNTYDALGALTQSRTTAVNVYTGQTDELHNLVIAYKADGSVLSQSETTTERNVGTRDSQGRMIYIVQAGDTLSSIASKVWADTGDFGFELRCELRCHVQ